MKKAHKITPKRRSQRGFTMIELMITVTLVAILASIAVPSMQTYVLNSRVTGTTQEILRSLQTARSEALRRPNPVVVCGSANPDAGDKSKCNNGTTSGWIVFQDVDGNGDHADDGTEELIEVHTIDANKLKLFGDGVVTYQSTGFSAPGGATAIVVCDSRGNVDSGGQKTGPHSVARGVSIAGTGRARVTNDLADITTLLKNIGSSC